MSTSQTYLITGGSGFLGINLIRHLLQHGHKIVNLDIAPFEYPEIDQITDIRGDIRDRAKVDAAMAGVNVVVHCAAALPLYKKEDIFSTDIDGTRNVIDSAHQHGVTRFIQISSTAVYGIPDHHPLYETDPMVGVGAYGIAKIEAERMCLDYRSQGMSVTIIRPKSFVGPERLGVFALFYDYARTGHNFPVLGNGNNHYQLLDVADLCEVIYRCATLDAAQVNDTFNIGAKVFTTVREDYQAVLTEAGFGKRIYCLPAGPAIFILRILEKLHLSPLYKWIYETFSKDSFVSIEKAERLLGYAPQYSNRDALVRNYHWYLENVDKIRGQSGVSHRVPWKQGILNWGKLVF